MPRLFAHSLHRLDAIYRDGPFFAGVKARLLAGFNLAMFVFIPANIAKLLWLQPPYCLDRVAVNVSIGLVAVSSMRFLFRGRLALAGNTLVLATLIIENLALLFPRTPIEPVGTGMSFYTYDIVILLAALIFSSRRVAYTVLALEIVGHLGYYWTNLRGRPLPGTLEFASMALMRDGLIGMCLIFFLGLIVVRLVETAQQRSEQALRETRALNQNLGQLVAERTLELQRLNDEKNVFMGMAAHDLRNPAVRILTLIEAVRVENDYSESRLRTDLATIGDTANRQLELLTDLLNVTAIEEGKVALRLAPLDARAILRAVHADFHGRAVTKGLDLVLVPSPHATLPALLDAAAIRQVLDNLVSNALKYSPTGKRVWLSAESVPGCRVRFAVRDEGPGLSEADRTQLFGKFSRLSARPTAGESSTGLGLSIVKRLVDGMAGTIAVDSTPGQGATFRADFPAA